MSFRNSKSKKKDSDCKKAVFLDRDGTVCEDVNYLSRVEQLAVFPFAAQAIRRLIENDFLVIMVTNQSGIARGLFNQNALHIIHEKLADKLAGEKAKLDAVYFCPHRTEDNCACRKPRTGMIMQAARDFSIDLTNSWMIGDKAIDVETGFRAKTKTALVLTGYGKLELDKLARQPDVVAENLFEAVNKILVCEEM